MTPDWRKNSKHFASGVGLQRAILGLPSFFVAGGFIGLVFHPSAALVIAFGIALSVRGRRKGIYVGKDFVVVQNVYRTEFFSAESEPILVELPKGAPLRWRPLLVGFSDGKWRQIYATCYDLGCETRTAASEVDGIVAALDALGGEGVRYRIRRGSTWNYDSES